MQPVENETLPLWPASHFVLWYVLGALAGIGLGGLAAALNLAGFAPIGILPICVGIALGAVLVGLAAATRINCSRRLIIGAVVLAIVAVLAEHAWLYVQFRREWHRGRAESPQIAMFRPETPWSPAQYFAHQASASGLALWCADAALLTTATAGTVVIGRRLIK
jgi:exosortase/archaeosortase